MSESVSNVARAIAGIVNAYPERAAIDLHEMLSHSLALKTPAQEREIDLGLVVEMIETNERLPKRDEYRHERETRNACGRDGWQSDSYLLGVFGKWSHVQSAALYVVEDRSDRLIRRKDDERLSRRRRRKYSRDDCKAALIACFEATGDWPHLASEYEFWQQVQRRHERRVNADAAPWLPSSSLIKKKFGDWDRAIELAQKKYAQRF